MRSQRWWKERGNWELFKIRLGGRDFPKHCFFGQTMDVQCSILCTFVYLFREIWLKDPLGGGLKYFYFHTYLGKWSKLTNIFQLGWNHQPVLNMFDLTIYHLQITHLPPSFGAPTSRCQGMDSNTWNLWVMVTNMYSMTHMITDFLPQNLWPITGVSSTVQPLHRCYFWWQHVVWKVKKSKSFSGCVLFVKLCGQVYRAIGSNSDCCQWCDDWIPNGPLFVNSWVQRGKFTMGPRGGQSRKKLDAF